MGLKEIFTDAVETERKGIKIVYVRIYDCDKCNKTVSEIDEEYSFYYESKNESVTLNELEEELQEFSEDYDIYDGLYEDDLKAFVYVGSIGLSNVYYYYVEDVSNNRCSICKKVFGEH